MNDKVVKVVDAEIKVISDQAQHLEATMSTERIDRDGESISVKGWDTTDFKRHPVLVSSHDYGGGFLGAGAGLLKQIGEWKNIVKDVGEGTLKGDPVYYTDQFRKENGISIENAEADWGYFLAKMGMATYSVGFIPTAWKDHDDGDGIKTPFRTYTRQSLLETSHVIIPSNADALGVMRGKGHGSVHPAVMRPVARLLRDIEAGKATYLDDYQHILVNGFFEQEEDVKDHVGFTADEKALVLEASKLFIEYVKATPAKFAAVNHDYTDDDPEAIVEESVTDMVQRVFLEGITNLTN